MIQLPEHLKENYQAYCRHSGFDRSDCFEYLKWLRFFLDYCEKYNVTGEWSERTRPLRACQDA